MRCVQLLVIASILLGFVCSEESYSFVYNFHSSRTDCTICGSPYGGYACSTNKFPTWNNGMISFTDPLPPRSTLNQVQLKLVGEFGCGTSSTAAYVSAIMNYYYGTIGYYSPTYARSCYCGYCDTPGTILSSFYNSGFPTYNYGGNNTIQLTVTNANNGANAICLAYVNVTLFYDLQGSLLVPGVQTYGSTTGGGYKYWRLEVNQARYLNLNVWTSTGYPLLLLKKDSLPSTYTYDYSNSSSSPSLYINHPDQGTYYVGVYAQYSTYTTFYLLATVGDNVPIRPFTSTYGVVPANTSYVYNTKIFGYNWAQFTLNVTNPSGDAVLMINNGSIPYSNSSRWSSTGSRYLQITISNPPGGIYYIKVFGRTYSNYELSVYLDNVNMRRLVDTPPQPPKAEWFTAPPPNPLVPSGREYEYVEPKEKLDSISACEMEEENEGENGKRSLNLV